VTDDLIKLDDLPSTIPVFPLGSVILLPRSNLPLNIFEPRYLQMVKDSRANHSLIGMIQPLDAADKSSVPATYGIGCVGKITDFDETKDGRNIIRLTGLCRFEVQTELNVMTPYRQIQANWQTFSADLRPPKTKAPLDRDELMTALKAYLKMKGLAADYEGINTAPDDVLINTLSMIIPFGIPEKQALLEAADTTERAETLKRLLIMMTSATQPEAGGQPS